MLTSFLIPLVTLTLPTATTATNEFQLSVLQAANSTDAVKGFQLNPEQVLLILFGLGFFVFTLKFLIGNMRVLYLLRKSKTTRQNQFVYRVSAHDIHPFSFFRHIVIPDRILQSPQLAVVLLHEQIHADEQHSIDVFLAELLFLFQWFNPFAWFMKDAVKNNLEFLTDDQIIRQVDQQHYQLAMVAVAGKKGIAPFLTALNGSQLKSRIMMMKKNTGNKRQSVRKLLLIPILSLLVLTLSNKEFEAAPLPPGKNGQNFVFTNDSTHRLVLRNSNGNPLGQPLFLVDGKEIESIDKIAPEDIESITVLKDESATKMYGERGKNGVVLIEMKTGKSSAKPAIASADSSQTKPQTTIRIRPTADSSGTAKRPLIFIDGENKGNVDVNSLDLLPDNIESIDVLKDPKLTEPYGEAAKDGVIRITTKK